MSDFSITLAQLFGIGFSFSLSGPCLILCVPVLVTYFSGRQDSVRKTLRNLGIFLLGRSFAYTLLGLLTGISSQILNQFLGSTIVQYMGTLGGGVIIVFGILLWSKKHHSSCPGKKFKGKNIGIASLFLFGILLGLSPCPPLLGLLFELIFIAKTPYHGTALGFAFAAGTFLSGLIAIGSLGSLFSWLPRRLSPAEGRFQDLYPKISGSLLAVFGLWLVISSIVKLNNHSI